MDDPAQGVHAGSLHDSVPGLLRERTGAQHDLRVPQPVLRRNRDHAQVVRHLGQHDRGDHHDHRCHRRGQEVQEAGAPTRHLSTKLSRSPRDEKTLTSVRF